MDMSTETPEATQAALAALIRNGSAAYSASVERAAGELGLAIQSSSGLISLMQPVELLDRTVIEENLPREGVDLEVFWSIGSTNSYLMEQASQFFAGYRICLAEQQMTGRGRRGRTWISPFGSNLYMSLARKYLHRSVDLGGLSLAVGIQVVKALRELGALEVGLKWPNDVILGDGKLAGILVEIGAPVRDQIHTVVGIGVNTRLTQEDRDRIGRPLSTLEGLEISRNTLAGHLLSKVMEGMDTFAGRGFAAFHQEWDTYHLHRGREVVVHLGDKQIPGIDRGVDESGNLLLDTTSGVRAFNAGEVSLRPVEN